ncbi:MAG: flagellin [Nitrososphaeria archaeon]|nr:flagellin [Nitrososphaeria archaeon]
MAGNIPRRKGSTSISMTFLIIASFIIASMVSGTMFYSTKLILESVEKFRKNAELRLNYRIYFIGGGFNESGKCIFVILENRGKIPINAIDKIVIVYGGVGSTFKPEYSSNKNLGSWNIREMFYENSRWDVGEPILIRIYNVSNIIPPYFIELHLENGLTYSYRFGDKIG